MLSTDRLCMGCMNDNGGEKICKICGYDSSVPNPQNSLPVKFWIKDKYLVGKMTQSDKEGFNYIGWDNNKNSIVNIKEYFPSGFAERNPDKTVSIIKGSEYIFNEGLMEFIDINRTILESEQTALIPNLDVFEENGTVYAISENISGISLKSFLEKNGGTLKWEQARPLFLPVIDTIKAMHKKGIIHRAISTDTIMVGRDGKLRIKDYCIKRIHCKNENSDAELLSGFAAIEQYGFEDMHDDCYTDVYGLCATLFTILIGNIPPEAPSRLKNDSMTIPAKFAEELPRHVLSALANGLQVLPQDRTKNIEVFKNELVYGEITAPIPLNNKPSESKKNKEQKIQSDTPKKKKTSTAKYVLISSCCTAAVFIIIAGVLLLTVFKDNIFKKNAVASAPESSESMPSIEQIGSVDSGAEVQAKLYAVPLITGKFYSELLDNEDYSKFKFEIKGKEFSDKFTKGQICWQSLESGKNVEKDTTIQVVISLGPAEIKIANVLNLTETEAKLELLKQGFLYDNIEVLEKYDQDKAPDTVLEQDPKYGTSVNTDIPIKIYVNSYKEDEQETSDTSSKN